MSGNHIRVLHCPSAVGGNPQGIARAERELGLASWAVSFQESPFGYDADEVLWSDKGSPIRFEFKRWKLLWRAMRDFDVIHFSFGKSILPQRIPSRRDGCDESQFPVGPGLVQLFRLYGSMFELRDLPVLKKLGKGIVVTYQGDDARQGDYCAANFDVNPINEMEPGYYSEGSDIQKRQRIAKFARYADRIYSVNPDLLHVLPSRAEFIPYSHIDLRDWKPNSNSGKTPKAPVVVHAPSKRGVKGTRFVLDAVSRLKNEGVRFEFVLVENLSHAEARKLYEMADIFVDQLLCGWYGAVAVEAMALGKPVVCYIREGDLKFLPEEMREEIPIVNATPETIYEVLNGLLAGPRKTLRETGQRGRRYVENWHDPLKIAARLKQDYEAILVGGRC